MRAPPVQWQSDLASSSFSGGASQGASQGVSTALLDDVGRLLDEDDARTPDLVTLLRQTGPAYSPQPAGVRRHCPPSHCRPD